MPPLSLEVGAAKLGFQLAGELAEKLSVRSLEEFWPRSVPKAEELLARPIGNLADGAKWTITNPKNGSRLETSVTSKLHMVDDPKDPPKPHRFTKLWTGNKEEVATVVHSLGPMPWETALDYRYGNPPLWKPYVHFDYMIIDPKFRHIGVREAVVNDLRETSHSLGFNGRVKGLITNDIDGDGTVSAVPWYKAGFRLMPSERLFGERFDNIDRLLKEVVDSRMQLNTLNGRIFDDKMIYLPEK